MSTDKQIAETILAQLGGRRFMVMTGAKNFSFSKGGTLSFSLPGNPGFVKNKARYVRVVLEPTDYYTVEFLNRKGTQISRHEGICCETLAKVFSSETGLRTAM